MHTTLKWQGEMAFQGQSDSGHLVRIDSGLSVGGRDQAPRPIELIAMGLAGCTAMDVISIMRKKRQDVTRFEVVADIERAPDHPRIFTAIHLIYRVTGRAVDEAVLKRAIELSESRYCPAMAMFRQVAPISISYEIAAA
jgi:putative redox protein